MKIKILSILMSLCMVVSMLPTIVVATDDADGTTGISVTVDGGSDEDKAEITDLAFVVDGVIYTEGDMTIKPDSTVSVIVYGNNLHKIDRSNIIDIPNVYVSPIDITVGEGGVGTYAIPSEWFEGATNYPIMYTNDSWANTVDSGITVTYVSDEEFKAAVIDDISITVDGVTYTEGNVIIRPDSTVFFTVIGQNLQNVDQSQIIDTPLAYLPLHNIPLQEDGTYIYTTYASVFVGGNNYNISYTNDSWNTSVATDIYVTYQESHDCEYGDWIISKQPTFTSSGEQYRTCSACGETETETIEMLVGKVSHWNIVLEDDFEVKFYLQVSESIENTAKVQLAIGKKMMTYDIRALEKNEEGYYFLKAEVAAAQMNESIAVTVMNGADRGSTETYSVRQYCDKILADDAHSQYHALVKEMLNYGAMAQVYFNYDANNLVNTGITDVAGVEIPESTDDLNVRDEIAGLDFCGASLVCRDRIAVRYYFAGDVTGLTFVANGNTYTPVAKDELYYIEISDILPQNLDQQITLTVTDAEGNALSVSYAPMNYIVRMNVKGNDDLKNLLKALYNYHLAAKALLRDFCIA